MAHFFLLLALVLGSALVSLLALHFAFRSERTAPLRLHAQREWKLGARKVLGVVAVNGTVSALVAFLVPWFAREWLVADGVGSPVQILWQTVAALMVNDFAYYFLHRYPFHQWKRLQRIHTLHHTIKHPTAVEALYASPLENILGLLTFFASIAVVGPVSPVAFLLIVGIYSTLNIVIHMGFAPDSGMFWPLGYMARKHNRHHRSMKAGNYASTTPLPDLLFGTLEND